MPIYQLSPGDVFDGKYRVEQQLGQGGMAIVYRVTEVGEVATEHALKLIRLPSFPSEEALAVAKERFRQEAAILARVRNPHIVGVHRYDVAADGTPYLLMELLDGEDLAAVLKRVQSLPWASALAVLEQMSLALTVLHKAGLVHRDLSPGNIFLVQQGGCLPEESVFVKLLDFGIAKRGSSEPSGPGAALTNPALRIGNPPYMAPECILRKPRKKDTSAVASQSQDGVPAVSPDEPEQEAFDGRADEFSLASIFFEMLAGRKAFLPAGADPVSAFGLVLNADPLADELPPLFTPAVRGVLDRAFSKDPDARFDTVAEFVAALRAVDPTREALLHASVQVSGQHAASAGGPAPNGTNSSGLTGAGAVAPSQASPALSPRFVILTGLVATVALLCITVYEPQLRSLREQLAGQPEHKVEVKLPIPTDIPKAPSISNPDSPAKPKELPVLLPPPKQDTPGGAAPKPDAPEKPTDEVSIKDPDEVKKSNRAAHGNANSGGLKLKKPEGASQPVLRFKHTYADAQQKERAAPALDIFHQIITDCAKSQRGWSQIDITAMSGIYASGLSSGAANGGFSNCLTDKMPAGKTLPKKTIVTRAN